MKRYKVGQRVKVIKTWDQKENILNKEAIIRYNSNGFMYLEFFTNIKGHDCEGYAKDGYGWGLRTKNASNYLMILNPFKIGDKVFCFFGVSKGSKGKVVHLGPLHRKGTKKSVWAYWNNDSYLSYLDSDILTKEEK